MEPEEWFKLKKYPHIGLPITIKDYLWVKAYVENPEKIQSHSFLPLIHKSIVKRKYRADTSATIRNPSGKRRRKLGKNKVRNIFFASHLDALIFSKYNEILVKAYEEYISTREFNECIVAYRKVPITDGDNRNKCNIDFAKTTFEFIYANRDRKLSVIVADVTSFFDNLNHQILKKQWCKVLDKPCLPKDHFNIFKTLTNKKYIRAEQLYESYNNTMLFECGVANSSNQKTIKRKKIKSLEFSKEKNAIAYCLKNEFIKNNLNLVISEDSVKGIPQGSPISATLANVYMLNFDAEVFKMVSFHGAFYQRYSDDLIIVCEQQYEDEFIKLIRDKIRSYADLDIEPSKTKVYRFENMKGIFTGFEINEFTKEPNYNRVLQYLGFSFDGQRVLIKCSGFSKYYRSMKSSFKKSTSLAIHSKNPDKRLFKSRLYNRFTYRGAGRKLIYRPSKLDKTKYEKTKEYYWGNYLSYIYKANEALKSINKNNCIKKQSHRFWRNFHKLMVFHEDRLKKLGLI